MSKSIWPVLLLLIAICAAFYFGWFAVKTSSNETNDKSNIEFSVDKGKVKSDTNVAISKAQDLGRKIQAGAESVVPKSAPEKADKPARLVLDPKNPVLDVNTALQVTVTRTDLDLPTLQLGLSPSVGSNLLASGGLFDTGQVSTKITITALESARSGTVAIVAEGIVEILDVTVRP